MELEDKIMKLRKEEGRIEAEILNLRQSLGKEESQDDEEKLKVELKIKEEQFCEKSEKFSSQVDLLFNKLNNIQGEL